MAMFPKDFLKTIFSRFVGAETFVPTDKVEQYSIDRKKARRGSMIAKNGNAPLFKEVSDGYRLDVHALLANKVLSKRVKAFTNVDRSQHKDFS